MLPASIEPSPPPPAPTTVCSSSRNRITLFSAAVTSSITFFSRSSNSPRYLEPATSAVRSRVTTRFSLRLCGTSPETIRWARPSTIAVLPTPGSPISTGLFLVRRERISTVCSISSARPTTGSSRPERASSVRSRPYSSSVGVSLGCAPVLLRSPPVPRPSSTDFNASCEGAALRSAVPAPERSWSSRAPRMCSGPMYEAPTSCERACAASSARLAEGVRADCPSTASGLPDGRACSRSPDSRSGSMPARSSIRREGSTRVAAQARCAVSRSREPSSAARRAASASSSCEDSLSSRPIGTRCTAGGEASGLIPKNRLSRSENGSFEPNGGMVTAIHLSQAVCSHTNTGLVPPPVEPDGSGTRATVTRYDRHSV